MSGADLIIRNIGQLATPGGTPGPRRGPAMSELRVIEGAAVAAEGGTIVALGGDRDVAAGAPDAAVIDAGGRLVTPGLVDPHTHAVFASTREAEFSARVAGSTYEEIAESGGGIRSSVRAVRTASEDALVEAGRRTLDRMLEHGTTTAEVKSGYGLSLESEVKMLRAIATLDATHAINIVPTFMGAHEFPDEWRDDRDGYVRLVAEEMIPAVSSAGLARFCDVFCERGVFTVEQSRTVLEAGRANGLEPKLHADELHASGGAELAAELGAASADHLVRVSDEGIRRLAAAGVPAVLLPGTTLSLGTTVFAPARKLVEEGAVVALATDCNPGSSMTESMQIVMALASMMMRLTPEEVLTASTANAAAAIGEAGRAGELAVGLPCDLVIWEVDDYRAIPYHYGVNLASVVVKAGRVVAGGRSAAGSS